MIQLSQSQNIRHFQLWLVDQKSSNFLSQNLTKLQPKYVAGHVQNNP